MVAYTENGCHVLKLSLKLNGSIARTFTNICLFKEIERFNMSLKGQIQ